jgi:hypothetical protein
MPLQTERRQDGRLDNENASILGYFVVLLVTLNASLKKLIERVEVGPEGVNVIAKGALPVPELERQVAKDGSFTFVAE